MEQKTLVVITMLKVILRTFANNILEFLKETPEEYKVVLFMSSGAIIFLLLAIALKIGSSVTLPSLIGSMVAVTAAYRTCFSCRDRQRQQR
jgi:hypothetical protein